MPDYETYVLPDVGDGLVEAEIVRWKIEPADTVAVSTPVVQIEAAKTLVDLPSPWSGVVHELLVSERTTVAVGTPIYSVDVDRAATAAAQAAGPPPTRRRRSLVDRLAAAIGKETSSA